MMRRILVHFSSSGVIFISTEISEAFKATYLPFFKCKKRKVNLRKSVSYANDPLLISAGNHRMSLLFSNDFLIIYIKASV